MFIDGVTADRCIRLNSEAYKAILSVHVQPKGTKQIGWCFPVQMDNDPKETMKTTQDLLKAQKWNIFRISIYIDYFYL